MAIEKLHYNKNVTAALPTYVEEEKKMEIMKKLLETSLDYSENVHNL